MSNKVIKSVSFNVTSADDAAMLKAVKRKNFSGYVKSLIMADLKARAAASEVQEAGGIPIQPERVPTRQEGGQRLEELKRKQGEQRPAPKLFNRIGN